MDDAAGELSVLQINFTYVDMTTLEYEETVAPLAEPIAEVDGLLWKVWVINEEANESGGIYLFENMDALNAYLGGEIVAGLAAHPQIADISAKAFDVMDDMSAITRAPLGEDE